MRLIFSQFCRTETTKMDTSRLPKIQDAERESQFGYVHGVSGPGRVLFTLRIVNFSCLTGQTPTCETCSETLYLVKTNKRGIVFVRLLCYINITI